MRSIHLAGQTEVLVPEELETEVGSVIRSYRQIGERVKGEQHVFRIADIGAGAGVFAAFAAMRWPYAYLDCFETRAPLAMALRLNAQPGTKFSNEIPKVVPECDGLHIGAGTIGLAFDAAALEKLRMCLWEFDDEEQFEASVSICKLIGLKLAFVSMVDRGPPVRGWTYWIRPRGSKPNGALQFDMDRKPSKSPVYDDCPHQKFETAERAEFCLVCRRIWGAVMGLGIDQKLGHRVAGEVIQEGDVPNYAKYLTQ